jgi:hypothetical protein
LLGDPGWILDSPAKALTFNEERSRYRLAMPDKLPEWWAAIEYPQNPLRQTMHELGLFPGMRPGTLVSMRREWIHFEEHAIRFPKMKSGRSFNLPL